MSTRRWSLIALAPVLASLGVLAFVLFRAATSVTPAQQVQDSRVGPNVLSNADSRNEQGSSSPLSDVPRMEEETEVSRSQIIAIGTVSRALGDVLIPPTGYEPSETDQTFPGIRTMTFEFEVARYIEGKANGEKKTIVLQINEGVQLEVGERTLVMLVPWLEGTYQASEWKAFTEDDEVVRYLDGTPAPEASSLTLDQYADRLEAIVAKHAASGAPTALAVPPILPGQEISASHFLGLRGANSIRVSDRGSTEVSLNAAEIESLLAAMEEPIQVEAASFPEAARTARVTFQLADGHVWEFQYDPSTGTVVYPASGLQAGLPDAARSALEPALVRAQ